MDNEYLRFSGEVIGQRQKCCHVKTFCDQKNGINFAVLSDGSPESELSYLGAEITAKFISDYLANKFDELYSTDFYSIEDRIDAKKKIVDKLVEVELRFIRGNPEVFSQYMVTHESEINKAVSNGLRQPLLMALDATILMFAEKDGKYIIGRIGNGAIGIISDGVLSIAMKEPESEKAVEIRYPRAAFQLGADDSDTYDFVFEIKKMGGPNSIEKKIDGVVLTSEGTEGIIECVDRNEGTEKYYDSMIPMLNGVAAAGGDGISNRLWPWLDNKMLASNKGGDCSLALIIRSGCEVTKCALKYSKPSLQKRFIDDGPVLTAEAAFDYAIGDDELADSLEELKSKKKPALSEGEKRARCIANAQDQGIETQFMKDMINDIAYEISANGKFVFPDGLKKVEAECIRIMVAQKLFERNKFSKK